MFSDNQCHIFHKDIVLDTKNQVKALNSESMFCKEGASLVYFLSMESRKASALAIHMVTQSTIVTITFFLAVKTIGSRRTWVGTHLTLSHIL